MANKDTYFDGTRKWLTRINVYFRNKKMMGQFRYFIQLAYDGSSYHGWQVQPNAVSVQGELQKALSLLLRCEVSVTGAGRTDTGVHASFFVAHFDLEEPIDDTGKIVHRLNSFLPDTISINTLFLPDETHHARFDATSRTYKYFIAKSKSPFSRAYAYRHYYALDVSKMNRAAEVLFDYIDFTSFSKLHTDVKTNNCKIVEAQWDDSDDHLVFTIRADRFLRNMVRAVVGTLIEVGEGKLSVEQFRNIIERKDRCVAGASAPAHGLFLTDITYPSAIEEQLVRNGSGFFSHL